MLQYWARWSLAGVLTDGNFTTSVSTRPSVASAQDIEAQVLAANPGAEVLKIRCTDPGTGLGMPLDSLIDAAGAFGLYFCRALKPDGSIFQEYAIAEPAQGICSIASGVVTMQPTLMAGADVILLPQYLGLTLILNEDTSTPYTVQSIIDGTHCTLNPTPPDASSDFWQIPIVSALQAAQDRCVRDAGAGAELFDAQLVWQISAFFGVATNLPGMGTFQLYRVTAGSYDPITGNDSGLEFAYAILAQANPPTSALYRALGVAVGSSVPVDIEKVGQVDVVATT